MMRRDSKTISYEKEEELGVLSNEKSSLLILLMKRKFRFFKNLKDHHALMTVVGYETLNPKKSPPPPSSRSLGH